MVAGTFRARRGRADVGDLLQAAATPRGAFRRPPEGRAHKRPSIRMRGIPPRAPRLRAPLSALDVCRIRPRADAAHLDACGRADHSFLGGSTTSVVSHVFLRIQRAPRGLWQGAARGQYRAYCQGSQHRHRPRGACPPGARGARYCRVVALANMLDIGGGPRLALARTASSERVERRVTRHEARRGESFLVAGSRRLIPRRSTGTSGRAFVSQE